EHADQRGPFWMPLGGPSRTPIDIKQPPPQPPPIPRSALEDLIWAEENDLPLPEDHTAHERDRKWQQVQAALEKRRRWLRPLGVFGRLAKLSSNFKSTTFQMPTTVVDAVNSIDQGATATYPALMADIFKYLLRANNSGMPKPNVEDRLAARFSRLHSTAQTSFGKKMEWPIASQITSAFPSGGIQHNNVNRLLLMSSSEHHLASVPMAFLISRQD
ncbi:hypothetical protein, partial [Bradyrhizobium sp. 48]|uniref:hypothetical protein n=1 Tax=Bradyrhizobium sp. 48 TaxID=2782676 RepID=UPI001FF99D39